MVGFSEVPHTTPRAVIGLPPSAVIFPPAVADVAAISETASVETVKTLDSPPSVMVQPLVAPVRTALASAAAPGEYLLLPPLNTTPFCTVCAAQPISNLL